MYLSNFIKNIVSNIKHLIMFKNNLYISLARIRLILIYKKYPDITQREYSVE